MGPDNGKLGEMAAAFAERLQAPLGSVVLA
jgi:hypothetical protein